MRLTLYDLFAIIVIKRQAISRSKKQYYYYEFIVSSHTKGSAMRFIDFLFGKRDSKSESEMLAEHIKNSRTRSEEDIKADMGVWMSLDLDKINNKRNSVNNSTPKTTSNNRPPSRDSDSHLGGYTSLVEASSSSSNSGSCSSSGSSSSCNGDSGGGD